MEEFVIATKLTKDLSHPMQWKYRAHVLKSAKKDQTKNQFFAELKSYLSSIGNMSQLPFIEKLNDNYDDCPTIFRNLEEEKELEEKSLRREMSIYKRKEKEIDYSVTASAQTRQLKFWNAYQNYKRDIRIRNSHSHQDKYYEKRAQLALVLDDNRRAFCLAEKAEAYPLMVAAKFADGDFVSVINLFEKAVIDMEKEAVTIITMYELLHMVGFALLAKWNFYSENNEIIDEFMSYVNENQNFEKIKTAVSKFMNREYKETMKLVREMDMFGYLSVYMSSSWKTLIHEINKNMAAHCVTPYAKITFDDINKQTGISRIEMPLILVEAIADNLISGKVNGVDKYFVADPNDSYFKDQKKINAIQNLQTMIKEGLWKEEMYLEMKKMTKKKL